MPDIPTESGLGADEKKCPYCAEIIKSEAILCRYCRMDLRTNQPLLQGQLEPGQGPTFTTRGGTLSDGGQVDEEVYRELASEIQFGKRLYSGFFDQDGACDRLLAQLRHAPGDPKALDLWNMFWMKFQVLSAHPEWGLTATYQYVSEQLLSIAADALEKAPVDTNVQTLASSISTNLGSRRPFVEMRGDALIVCPHCQSKGTVRTRTIRRKKGLSGAKIMGGLLTGGFSLLATGLSRKEACTEAHCSKCSSTWYF